VKKSRNLLRLKFQGFLHLIFLKKSNLPLTNVLP
jgi:hypothetical protein